MNARLAHHALLRRGLTIVELLVVTGLIASLLGLVLVGVRPGRSREQKRAADDLASVLRSAQSRALGVAEGAAVIVEPSGEKAGAVVYDAIMLPLIEGVVEGLPPGTPASSTASVEIEPVNADVTELRAAYKIRLFGAPPASPVQAPTAWMEFVARNVVTRAVGGITKQLCGGMIAFRMSAGQTESNTVWPKAPSGVLNGLLARYPLKSSAVAELEGDVAIDLRFSGVGDDPAATHGYGTFANKGSIAVVFDSVGRVSDVMQQVPAPGATTVPGTQPMVPSSLIYFFVASRKDVEDGNNTLMSEDAMWVVASPHTGRVSIASNVPQGDTTATSLAAARANARRGIENGGP